MIIGVPVALVCAATVIFLVTTGDYGSAMFLGPAGLGKISSIILVAIPLYILAGNLMIHGGLAGRLVDFAESLVGRIRGGMGIVVVVTMAVFGAISGMASSAVAAVGRSEEHTSELQSLMRNSYAVFCLTQKNYAVTNRHDTSRFRI